MVLMGTIPDIVSALTLSFLVETAERYTCPLLPSEEPIAVQEKTQAVMLVFGGGGGGGNTAPSNMSYILSLILDSLIVNCTYSWGGIWGRDLRCSMWDSLMTMSLSSSLLISFLGRQLTLASSSPQGNPISELGHLILQVKAYINM